MVEYFDEHPERLHYLLGILYLMAGIVIAVYFKCFNGDNECAIQWSAIFISLGIAFIAYGLSRKSDEASLKNAHYALNETINTIEDVRLLIREKSAKIDKKTKIYKDKYSKEEKSLDIQDLAINCSFKTWKIFRYLDRIKIYDKLLTSQEKNIIINQINHYFSELVMSKANYNIVILGDYYEHLQKIVEYIFKFKEFHDESSNRLIKRKKAILQNLDLLNPNIKLEKK
jgi:hypothetical protein